MFSDDLPILRICSTVGAAAVCGVVLGGLISMGMHCKPDIDGYDVHSAAVVRHVGPAAEAWVCWCSEVIECVDLEVGKKASLKVVGC